MKYRLQATGGKGFTLVEMMVSLALFTVVSTITVGALLSLVGGNQRLVKQQTLTSSAIFSLDNMTREIRTGSYYYCGDFRAEMSTSSVNDCANGNTSVSFIESSTRATSGGRVSYYFANGSLWRRIGTGSAGVKLLPDDVEIDINSSRFFVTGSQTLSGSSNDTQQPVVTVVMVLAATPETQPITLQTTITQRSLDI